MEEPLALCEHCGDEVPPEEIEMCDACEMDGLCQSCIYLDDHDCQGLDAEGED